MAQFSIQHGWAREYGSVIYFVGGEREIERERERERGERVREREELITQKAKW